MITSHLSDIILCFAYDIYQIILHLSLCAGVYMRQFSVRRKDQLFVFLKEECDDKENLKILLMLIYLVI